MKQKRHHKKSSPPTGKCPYCQAPIHRSQAVSWHDPKRSHTRSSYYSSGTTHSALGGTWPTTVLKTKFVWHTSCNSYYRYSRQLSWQMQVIKHYNTRRWLKLCKELQTDPVDWMRPWWHRHYYYTGPRPTQKQRRRGRKKMKPSWIRGLGY